MHFSVITKDGFPSEFHLLEELPNPNLPWWEDSEPITSLLSIILKSRQQHEVLSNLKKILSDLILNSDHPLPFVIE
jgi:hypothetical protein